MPLRIMTFGYVGPRSAGMGAGRDATMSRDEVQDAYHRGMILGQNIQGNLLIWPAEAPSAERARLSAG
jgi:hypothetical protein